MSSRTLSSWTIGPDVVSGERFEKLIDYYDRSGAFRAGIAWYRANVGYSGTGIVVVPTTMPWPEDDPLFVTEWADRLPEFFTDATLTHVPDCGHLLLLKAP